MQNIYDEEKFAKQYDSMRNDEKGANANDLIEIPNFKTLVPDVTNKSILDLGCGYGEMSKYYKDKGASYVMGIDISKHMIEIANTKNKEDGIDFKVMAMEQLDTLDKKFDIVISSLAFHYVEDFKKLVKDIYNLLNDDGYLIFSQEHPMVTCVKFTENITSGHTMLDNKYYGLISDYNRPGKRIKKWYNNELIKYHRNIEEIINPLIEAGFTIEKVLEPKPSEEAIKAREKYKYQWDRPLFIFFKVKKHINM